MSEGRHSENMSNISQVKRTNKPNAHQLSKTQHVISEEESSVQKGPPLQSRMSTDPLK